MKRFLKIHRWWDYQLTIMLGFVYHLTATAPTMPHLLSWLMTFVLFVPACVGIAGFGHLVNDYFDRETDRLSGAPNLVADQAAGSLMAKTAAVLALAWLPWLWLPTNSVILSLLILEFVLFVLYSMPVVRLKDTRSARACDRRVVFLYSLDERRDARVRRAGSGSHSDLVHFVSRVLVFPPRVTPDPRTPDPGRIT